MTRTQTEPAPASTSGPARHLVAVLADDLTGAVDSTAPFASRGLSVSVVLDGGLPRDAHVVALVTDNRWRPAEEARERTRAAVDRLREWGPRTLFVKIDSTLRGRVRDDVEAALEAWGTRDALATPAFPGQGRTVREDSLLVHGKRVVDRVSDHFPPGLRHLDVTSQDDLEAAARTVLDEDLVAVGSGGLSRALAAVLVPSVEPSSPAARPSNRASALLVVGSPHATTVAQVEHTLAEGALLVTVGDDRHEAFRRAAEALGARRRVVLAARATRPLPPDTEEAAELATGLATVARELVERTAVAGLVLTGGATAHKVAAGLGASEIQVLGEVAPGLPHGRLVTPTAHIPVVTKSGGFGPPDSLSLAATSLEDCP